MTDGPDFFSFWLPLYLPVLLVLTVYRLTRLVTQDDFPPVLWLRDKLAGGWRPLTEKDWELRRSPDWNKQFATQPLDGVENRWVKRADWSPHWLAELITCPWCVSGWITGVVVFFTDWTYGLPVPWLMGPAVWGAAALLASRDWS